MQLYPAIDIKNKQCVRLRQGMFHDVEVYSNTPVKVASLWEQQGASAIHLVDLDGVLVGHSVNLDVIKQIVQSVSLPAQVGGGIRTMKDIENLLNIGVSRVIIGTKAVQDSNFVKEAVKNFGSEKIVVGVDAKNGMVAIEGWEKVSNLHAVNFCLKMKDMGIKTIAYTDISKDGMLQGPNIEHTKELVDVTGIDIIASGGVSCMKDLENLYEINVQGAIIGKALYENCVDLKVAIQRYEKGV
ncbi:MAG: 1-(5-phosphoribosyl)-5-[(5-phosphoribosylamino)methylideneamino]imidazole-4-carboxamide isomerase [Lachnospiraceae bacterium]|jgi:phosphoribosylformimino-5-aminoimidazole carboxamide ribotide isomerase|nr:1-(5-phosphoribosyl)-5-[(5-phosphoribosylamino)methylideneamino]imidazole-4-carboxamide isomerase [Lachnospiraceae bacterium]